MKNTLFNLLGLLCLTIAAARPSHCQEPTANSGKLVDFAKHIQPILEEKCLKCHGPNESKGGLRVDDLAGLLDYVEKGNAKESSLWTDYLVTEDPDSIMPPANGTKKAGLEVEDLLLIRTWIDEGANGQWVADASKQQPAKETVSVPTSPVAKVWAFQGLFHPATVHLPIALLAVSGVFVLFSFFNRAACEPVAYHCLWIGAIGAVFACVTGWSYAAYEGYGAGFSFDLEKSSIDRHRWLGVFVAVFSLLILPVARNVRQTGDVNKRVIWFFAGLILFAGVSIVGFQGGELTYGEGHYSKYFKVLFNSESASDTTSEAARGKESAPPIDETKNVKEKLPDRQSRTEKEIEKSATTQPASTNAPVKPAQSPDKPTSKEPTESANKLVEPASAPQAEPVKSEPVKSEPVKSEPVKPDAAKPDAPRQDEPKSDAPKQDAPKQDESKPVEPKSDEPKIEPPPQPQSDNPN